MNFIWSTDVENILNNIRLNCILLTKYHKKKYYKYKGYLKYFRIPTIIFSAISSVISVGFQPYIQQGLISFITCCIGLSVGIINSLELFLSIQSTMENALFNSKEFYLLSIDIYKILSLDNKHRGTNGICYLEEKYAEYCKLIENSEIINKNISDKLSPIDARNISSKDKVLLKLLNKSLRNEIKNTNDDIKINITEDDTISFGSNLSYSNSESSISNSSKMLYMSKNILNSIKKNIKAISKEENSKEDNSKEDNSKEENSKEENSKEENSKEENSKEENSKEENSKEENSKEENSIYIKNF